MVGFGGVEVDAQKKTVIGILGHVPAKKKNALNMHVTRISGFPAHEESSKEKKELYAQLLLKKKNIYELN